MVVIPQLNKFVTLRPLRPYFNVNNSYVFNKLKVIFCPFVHKSWSRRRVTNSDDDDYFPPRDDINAPDLYIPTMAFGTYVLLIGFLLGTTDSFTPEGMLFRHSFNNIYIDVFIVLGSTASSSLVVLILEIILIRLGMYLLNAPSILLLLLLDLISYCGYKYVNFCATMFVGLLFGRVGYYPAMLVMGLANSMFMVKTLRLAVPDGIGMDSSLSSKRNYFLFAIGGLQLVLCYFMTNHS